MRKPRRQHCDRPATGIERAAVGLAVDACRPSRDDDRTVGREVGGDSAGECERVGARVARAHDRDCVRQVTELPGDEELRRWVRELVEGRRPAGGSGCEAHRRG